MRDARLAFARNRRSLKSQMREGNRLNARFVLIIGEQEVEKKEVTVRPLDGGMQVKVPMSEIINWLDNLS